MMRGGGGARRLATVVTFTGLTVFLVASSANALGRPQDRWARPSARRSATKPRTNSLTGVLQKIWKAKQDKAAEALEAKAEAQSLAAAESEPRPVEPAAVQPDPETKEKAPLSLAKADSLGSIETLNSKVRASSSGGSAVGASSAPAPRRQPTRLAASGGAKPSGSHLKGGDGGAPPSPVAATSPRVSKNPPLRRSRHRGTAKNTLRVLTGKSLIIDLAKNAKRVSVANPEVAEVMIISSRQVMVNGLEDGETSIIIWDNAGNYAMYNLVVGDALEDQVMLEVTVAEINRSELERHGVDIRSISGQFGAVSQLGSAAPLSGGTYPPSQGDPLFPFGLGSGLTWGVVDFKNDIAAFFKQLQDENLAKVLAEPKLLARSGQTANFLSGGEIPIVITQDQNTTIEFKEFGTKVDFVPTVREDGTIDLKVKSEVSEPDFSQGLQLFGFTVPAFVTRRVDTRVTLEDGQSLIVAGLMKEKKRELESKMPFMGDIPLLGYLFRHTEFSNDVLELVMIVRPRLVSPIDEGTGIDLPTDRGPLTRGEVRTGREEEKVSRPRPF